MGNERERERLQTGKERDPRNIANGEGRRNGGISGEGEKVKMDYVTCLGQEQAILCPRVPAETSLHSVGCAHTNTHTHTDEHLITDASKACHTDLKGSATCSSHFTSLVTHVLGRQICMLALRLVLCPVS